MELDSTKEPSNNTFLPNHGTSGQITANEYPVLGIDPSVWGGFNPMVDGNSAVYVSNGLICCTGTFSPITGGGQCFHAGYIPITCGTEIPFENGKFHFPESSFFQKNRNTNDELTD